ncbi:MAG TPA: DUF5719 family protein, partial [Actinomycetota bacterium]
MRRGQAPLAFLVVAAVAAAAFAADRIGAAAPGPAPEPTATSSIWVCPHGGAEGWGGRVVVANPGDRPVEVRISSIGRRRPDPPVTRTVEPGRQLVEEVRADEPGRATVVEAFGGWVGAWWLVTAEDPGSLGAEPCAPGASSAWWAADAGTPQGEDAFLVVTNPTASDAVVDVALFTADRPPIRDAGWTDLELPARRSVALPLNRKAEGEDALLAEVLAEVGRVVVGSYVVGSDGGIRSVLATPSLGTARFLPVGGGADQATLIVGAPAEGDVGFGATLFGGDQAQPAGGLADVEQAGAAAHAYAIPTAGPSSVELEVREGVDVAAALRSVGRSPDD